MFNFVTKYMWFKFMCILTNVYEAGYFDHCAGHFQYFDTFICTLIISFCVRAKPFKLKTTGGAPEEILAV